MAEFRAVATRPVGNNDNDHSTRPGTWNVPENMSEYFILFSSERLTDATSILPYEL
jgi:hypothetical protein